MGGSYVVDCGSSHICIDGVGLHLATVVVTKVYKFSSHMC
jgi:hypothetical protein